MANRFNPDKQHTIQQAVSIQGTGLHTGMLAELTLQPASPGFGFQFQRTDLDGQPIIKADCDLVTDVSRGTTLESNGAKVSTVEHVLAALVGLGIDNCLLQINGPEIPIIDGSSQPFVELIEKAGIEEQDAAKIWYSIDENIFHYDEGKRVEMVAMPATEYQVTTLIDFNSPVLGTQHAGLKNLREFKKEIAPCRTFCFLNELEYIACNFIRTNRFPEDYFAKHDKIMNWVFTKRDFRRSENLIDDRISSLLQVLNKFMPKDIPKELVTKVSAW
jgi:UDP-3-O-[3-hydroxymyristoyl] N-acetylglucosamine deacetylase/3-hydroxyacyl-[acyl-carrier-protein] dehydratase